MNQSSFNYQYPPGTNVISLVEHPPEIQPGESVTIVRPWLGKLCAVQLPNGMIHRWFASFELHPVNSASNTYGSLSPGIYAQVLNTNGHGNPPHVETGAVVRIIKCIPTVFYDVRLSNGEYHRWLAEFELAKPI